MKNNQLLPLNGAIQNYAWGGQEFLANFTGRPKAADGTPWAELWLGAHPKGSALTPEGPLYELIANDPKKWLGKQTAEDWNGGLPFLLKVLDVQKMLSIQVHPTKEAAEIGFAAEELSGLARNAPNRNFRDNNHKPELGVAITDFYLLHGFKSTAEIADTLTTVPAWANLQSVLSEGGVESLYTHVMQADQSKVNDLLTPLAETLREGDYQSSSADFWARRAFRQYTKNGNYDRGIFSIYWFNLVHLRPGEGIFQAAGIPHAYLEGACVELMANSDNVLRGGLTPKHIDPPELIKQLDFTAVTPEVLTPVSNEGKWRNYPTPAPDFKLSTLDLTSGEVVKIADNQVAVYLVFRGVLSAAGQEFKEGDAFLVPAGQRHSIAAGRKGAMIYRATAS